MDSTTNAVNNTKKRKNNKKTNKNKPTAVIDEE